MRLGGPTIVETPTADEIRAKRIEVARAHSRWTEVEETALVPRGRMLVHAETDEVFTRARGTIFARGSATVIGAFPPFYFYVARDGELVFLERQPGTWSELVAKRERRRLSRR